MEVSGKYYDQPQSLNSKLEKLQSRKRRIINMRADEELTKEEFTQQKREILNEEIKIKSIIDDLSDSSNN